MADLEAALKVLKLSSSVNYTATLRAYKYDETMLRHCYQGKQVARENDRLNVVFS